MRLIDADAFKNYIREACEVNANLFKDGGELARAVTESFCKDIDEQPAIEVPEWIPIKTRPMDEEERVYYTDIYGWELTDEEAVIFECQMPEDGQEIWVCSKCGNVWIDTCEVEDGIGLEGNGDWADIVAWMPHYKPEPWKGGEDA